MSDPYIQYPKIVEVITLVGQGHTLTEACDLCAVSVRAFNAAVKTNASLQELFEEAEQRGLDSMAESLLRPDNHPIYGHSDPKMAKVQGDNIKWFLARRARTKYGDRMDVNVNVTADRVITDMLTKAKQRAITHQPTQVIDADFTQVDTYSEDEQAVFATLGLPTE